MDRFCCCTVCPYVVGDPQLRHSTDAASPNPAMIVFIVISLSCS
jgi:hypothetical protein